MVLVIMMMMMRSMVMTTTAAIKVRTLVFIMAIPKKGVAMA